jgi:CIC family chloride channel protein
VIEAPERRASTLAGSAQRWLALGGWAALLGVVSGLACVAARLSFRLLQWCFTGHDGLLADAAGALPTWRRALTPALGALCAWGVLTVRRRLAKVPPSTNYIEAVRQHDGVIPFPPTLWRTVSSAFSVATGAAVGREGSMIQFAAAAISWVARRRFAGRFLAARLPGGEPLSIARQVGLGAAAAVGAVYQAPVAGVFFATEIVLGRAAIEDYPLLLIAAVAGWVVSGPFTGRGPLFPAAAALGPAAWVWIWLLPFSLALGAVGPVYQGLIRSLGRARGLALALVWGGVGTGLLSLAGTEVWGNGDAALLSLARSHGTVAPAAGAIALLLALRLCATTLCVGVGTVGGVFTPTLFAGGAAGLLLAHAVHASAPLLFILIGVGALLSAVTHAPVMASFMTVELTGKWELLPVVFVCNLIAWWVASRISDSSLYGIATTTPGDRPGSKREAAGRNPVQGQIVHNEKRGDTPGAPGGQS